MMMPTPPGATCSRCSHPITEARSRFRPGPGRPLRGMPQLVGRVSHTVCPTCTYPVPGRRVCGAPVVPRDPTRCARHLNQPLPSEG